MRISNIVGTTSSVMNSKTITDTASGVTNKIGVIGQDASNQDIVGAETKVGNASTTMVNGEVETKVGDNNKSTTVTTTDSAFSVAGKAGDGISVNTEDGTVTFKGTKTGGSQTQTTIQGNVVTVGTGNDKTTIEGDTITTGHLITDKLTITGSGNANGNNSAIAFGGDGTIKSDIVDGTKHTTFETTKDGVNTTVIDGGNKTENKVAATGNTNTVTGTNKIGTTIAQTADSVKTIAGDNLASNTVGVIGQDASNQDIVGAETKVGTNTSTTMTDGKVETKVGNKTSTTMTDGTITNRADNAAQTLTKDKAETVVGTADDGTTTTQTTTTIGNSVVVGGSAKVSELLELDTNGNGILTQAVEDAAGSVTTSTTMKVGSIVNSVGDAKETTTTLDENGFTVQQSGKEVQITGTDVTIKGGSAGANKGNDVSLSDLGYVGNVDAELQARPEFKGEKDTGTAIGAINAEAGIRRQEISRLNTRLDRVGAMSAAIANLKTMGYDPQAPTELSMATGQYKDKSSLAMGVFHYPNRDFMLSMSVTTTGEEVMGGVGATWKFGRKSPLEILEKVLKEAERKRMEAVKLEAKAAKLQAEADKAAASVAKAVREAAAATDKVRKDSAEAKVVALTEIAEAKASKARIAAEVAGIAKVKAEVAAGEAAVARLKAEG